LFPSWREAETTTVSFLWSALAFTHGHTTHLIMQHAQQLWHGHAELAAALESENESCILLMRHKLTSASGKSGYERVVNIRSRAKGRAHTQLYACFLCIRFPIWRRRILNCDCGIHGATEKELENGIRSSARAENVETSDMDGRIVHRFA
jgi:hypothetical protein